MQPNFNRAGDGWDQRQADWETHQYNGFMVWVVQTNGRGYGLVLNSKETHFARKHLKLARADDAAKQGNAAERAFFESKAESRLAHRDVLANDRRMVKYQTEKGGVVKASTVLNLKAGAERRIEERDAAVRIAQAIGDPDAGANIDVIVDFGVACVMTAFDGGGVRTGNRMHIVGVVSVKNKENILLFHADTVGCN